MGYRNGCWPGALAVNRRYHDALTVVNDPSQARHDLRGLARTLRRNGRSYRGFNPAADEDIRLFAAIMRGEHAINGFRNRDIRGQLFKPTQDTQERTRRSARVCRLLKRLHIHGLIAKIPRTRRWRVTSTGQSLMATLLILHHEQYPKLLTRRAA